MSDSAAPLPSVLTRRADYGSKVLVVEDIPVTLEYLRALLADNGYRVTLTRSQAEAIAALNEGLPDLVVLDLLLPDGHGLQVCEHLRRLPGGEDIPVLVITVDERPQSHAEAVRARADDFLHKPLVATELKTRSRSLIRLRQLRAELRRDHEAILRLQAQKEELTQFLVHDLKNLTSSILAGVELMSLDPTPEQVERQRLRIGETTRSLVAMVQSMLDMSVHEQAGLVPQPERIAMEPWLRRVCFELEPLTLRRNQRLELELDRELELEADPQLLERLVFNLLENASKYGPSDSRIALRARQRDGLVCLELADEGEGIPEEKRDLVFGRFIRVDGLPGGRTGRGLGLAFCRMVTEIHGGSIRVEPNLPRGNRFVVELPQRFWQLGD